MGAHFCSVAANNLHSCSDGLFLPTLFTLAVMLFQNHSCSDVVTSNSLPVMLLVTIFTLAVMLLPPMMLNANNDAHSCSDVATTTSNLHSCSDVKLLETKFHYCSDVHYQETKPTTIKKLHSCSDALCRESSLVLLLLNSLHLCDAFQLQLKQRHSYSA